MSLKGDVAGEDPSASQPGWVWEKAWREDAFADKDEDAHAFGGGDGIPPIPPAVETISEETASRIEKENAKRRHNGRLLLFLCVSLVKAVLGERHRASHDVKAAQWAKSQGISRKLHDLLARLGFLLSASQLHHREEWSAKRVKDGDKMPSTATCAIIAQDNINFKRKHQGQIAGSPILNCLSDTSHTAGEEVGRFEDASKLKRRSELTLDDVI